MAPETAMNRSQGKKPISGSRDEQKRGLLGSFLESWLDARDVNSIEVNIDKLRKFFEDDQEASDILSTALSFAFKGASRSNWVFWPCACCEQILTKGKEYGQHFRSQHRGDLPLEIAEFDDLSDEWSEKLLQDSWKPVDCDPINGISESKDPERIHILERISNMVRILVTHKVLNSRHLKKMLTLSIDELRFLPPEFLIRNELNQNSVLCFRCLGYSKLNFMFEFLVTLCQQYEVGPFDREVIGNDDCGMEELKTSVVIDPDFSYLIISDPQLIERGFNSLDAVKLTAWVYGAPTVDCSIEAWKKRKEDRKEKSKEIVELLKENLSSLSQEFSLKAYKTRCCEALQKILALCEAEKIAREDAEYRWKHFTHFLSGNSLQSDKKEISSMVLFRAHALQNLSKLHSPLSEHYIEEDFIMKAIEQLIEGLENEVGLLYADIYKNIKMGRKLCSRLGKLSRCNYLEVIIPMLKSFLKIEWEKAAKATAGTKSNYTMPKGKTSTQLDIIDIVYKEDVVDKIQELATTKFDKDYALHCLRTEMDAREMDPLNGAGGVIHRLSQELEALREDYNNVSRHNQFLRRQSRRRCDQLSSVDNPPPSSYATRSCLDELFEDWEGAQ